MSLRAQRGPVRAALRRTLDELKDQLNDEENQDRERIGILFRRSKRHMDKLLNLDEQVHQHLLQNDASEEDFTDEYTAVNLYRDEYDELEQRALPFVRNEDDTVSIVSKTNSVTSTVQTSMSSSGGRHTKYRLPKIEMKKFGGDPKDWIGFWSQFKNIHEDDEICAEEKFQYLLQCTVESSPARAVVESFPPSAANYPKVVRYLKERFGRDEILIEVYVRELLGLVIKNIQKKGSFQIASIYDKLETQLRSLESLGVTSDKYAAMLFPLVESSLPEDVLQLWERNRSQRELQDENELANLMKFLRCEVDSEQRIRLAKKGFNIQEDKKSSSKKKENLEEIPTATDLFSGQGKEEDLCIFCNKKHESSGCYQAQSMTNEDKQKRVRDHKACFVCLKKGHVSRICKMKPKCPICQRKHLLIMCPNVNSKENEKNCGPPANKNTPSLSNCSVDNVLLQTLLVRMKHGEEERVVRAIVDSGSQFSYITTRAAEVLKLKKKDEIKMAHGLFGGTETKEQNHSVFEVLVESCDSTKSVNLTVLDQTKICSNVSRVPSGVWIEELRNNGIIITDVGSDRPEIHLLIGADFAGELLTGKIFTTMSGPIAVETTLGWTLMGKCFVEKDLGQNKTLLSHSLISVESSIQNLWRLDVLGIREPIQVKNEDVMIEDAIQQFQNSIVVNEDGRYEVALPWLECHPPVAENLEVAKKRLVSATRKLESQGKTQDYEDVFLEWKQMGIVEEVPVDEWDHKASYLPHRPVFNPNSKTTPIRPVFDASAKSKELPSVNDCLLKGPNLIELIPPMLMRFRMRKVAVTSDIKKAFLQISLKKEDRDYLRFLWWEKGLKKLKMYRHCRVVFGVSSSPFLLAATLNYHLDRFSGEEQHIAQLLKRSLYVDNCVASLDSEEETKEFVNSSSNIMESGKFDLRGWIWNSQSMQQTDEDISILGVKWNPCHDFLTLDLTGIGTFEENITKRKILSTAQRIFDPLGFAAPVSIVPKMMLQQLWETKIDWDEQVPDEVKKNFKKWILALEPLSKLKIPRWIMKAPVKECKLQLHLFCDASKDGYGCCIYLRSESRGTTCCQMVIAKSRVAPKKSTIPRLELLACGIGSRLLSNVKKEMEMEEVETYCWTDSSNALYWIQNNENWATFVFNRVQEIRKLTNYQDWRHIPGKDNPADLPSRGCNGKQLVESRWWEGPQWLYQMKESWPVSALQIDRDVIATERKKVSVSVLNQPLEKPWYVSRYSSFKRIVIITAWILRWKKIALNKEKYPTTITLEEKREAELRLWKNVQDTSFRIKGSLLKQMHATKDEDGIRRVRSKIVMREDSEDFRFPILLPCDHPLVEMLIRENHLENHHVGTNTLMCILREKYWILKNRKTVKQVVSSCWRCKRVSAKAASVEEAPLPVDRVRDARPFEVVGVDMGGPLYVNKSRKVWFVVFSCAVIRAIHLELVTSLSSDAFVMALRRFIARRGRPEIIYSDNGKNFVGLENLLKELDWKVITSTTGIEKIEWRFNAPAAPWWGGFWERMVRSVKDLLRRCLGKKAVKYEELETLFYEIEALINSRPLTYVSENVEDPISLSPQMFLGIVKSTGIPDMDALDGDALRKKYKNILKIREDLRARFRSEYLGSLKHVDKLKVKREVRVGDVVLLELENSKRMNWPLARIVELIPGRDGINRMALLKTENSTFVRPVQRLYPLEVGV